MFTDFSDLETDTAADAKPAKTEEKHVCGHCQGTGEWRRGSYVGKCHACNGRGYFKTSKEHRAKAKARRVTKKANERKAFADKHADLLLWLDSVTSWNDFALSLVQQFKERGSLTDNQVAAAERMKAKTEATQAKKAAEKAAQIAAAPVVGTMARVHKLFEDASRTLKSPKLRFGELTLSKAPLSGKNAGCLYVKDAGEYAGKITADGHWLALRSAREGITAELQTLAADPLEALKAHGQKFGNCACCGRELTNSQSIELGIGPICADKWGL